MEPSGTEKFRTALRIAYLLYLSEWARLRRVYSTYGEKRAALE
jgi:hypothetical protein